MGKNILTCDSSKNGGLRLSKAVRKGLLVARRSALEMVTKACTVDGDVNSWIRVPRDTQTIEEAMRVYGLLNILRDKCPSDPAPAQEAAIAVRDVMVVMATSTYPSCEHQLQDIAVQF